VLSLASNRLRASREDIFEALQAEEITPAHRFVLAEIMAEQEHPLRGQNSGLRGTDGGTQCATLGANVDQTRVRADSGLSR
jgi:hypothetical protein